MVAGEDYVLTVCCTPSADFQYFNPHLMSGSYGGVFENGYSDGTLEDDFNASNGLTPSAAM
jgi:hypothetical protein